MAKRCLGCGQRALRACPGQIEGAGAVRHKKMFGEYMIYVNHKAKGKEAETMVWLQAYPESCQPTAEQISGYIANPLWEDLSEFLKESYQVEPSYVYSGCSGQPGWNVKYQKGGRSLCTLYPMQDFFIALVVIGNKEQAETELLLSTLSDHVQSLYGTAASVRGGRWLMIHVTDERISEDVKQLIQIRRKVKKVK